MLKIRRLCRFGVLAGVGLGLAPVSSLAAQAPGTVSGRITIAERDNRSAQDLDQAVVWLTGSHAPAGQPVSAEMATENKQFVPRLLVLPAGSTLSFPNHDPFNHNVFSLSPEQPFDLGLYGRGGAKSVVFETPGIIRVFCNVHAQMRAIVVVRESGLVTQPGADGSFSFAEVPAGEYQLHVWHERAQEVTQPLRVTAGAGAPLVIALDARGYRFVQHKDKNGRSYGDRSRRY
ncbi:MAG: carboxypeptidase regulatory-like domain-containing protein [Gemmatimonadales bacterium]